MSQLEREHVRDTGGMASDEVSLQSAGTGHLGHGDDVAPSSDDFPSVAREKWVQQSNFWESQIVLAGHRPARRPRKRPLPRPQRFREPSRWRGALVLAIVLLIIGVFGIGIVEMSSRGTGWILPLPISTPVSTHTITSSPTPTHAPTP